MSADKHKGERIAKRMARAGVCSRRDAEKWITAGRVSVNGRVIESPALNVVAEDKILLDGKALPDVQETKLYLYHKPPGLVTTHKDEKGRATVFDELPDFVPRVVSVGRLDLNTEGLLLLTNDGELSRYLELPATGWARKYRVRVHGKVDIKRLESLKNGITVDGVRYKSIEAILEERAEGQGTNSWISMTLREGKNREIRRVLEAIGLKVTRLIRTDYGPFTLGKMTRGSVIEVKPNVMKQHLPQYCGQNSKPQKTQNLEKKRQKSGKNAKNSSKSPKKHKKNEKRRKG